MPVQLRATWVPMSLELYTRVWFSSGRTNEDNDYLSPRISGGEAMPSEPHAQQLTNLFCCRPSAGNLSSVTSW